MGVRKCPPATTQMVCPDVRLQVSTDNQELPDISEKPEPERSAKIELTPRKQNLCLKHKRALIKMNNLERVKGPSYPFKKCNKASMKRYQFLGN